MAKAEPAPEKKEEVVAKAAHVPEKEEEVAKVETAPEKVSEDNIDQIEAN